MQRPNILNDTDKYQFDPNDFPRQLDKYFFSAIYNLYVNGAEKIHTVDIDQYLQDNPSAKELIDNEKGIQMLQDCESYAELGNFNYYYNSFKKFALLRELSKSGRDISFFYCENPLHPDYNKINQKFESLKPVDIINHLKGEVAALEDKYSTNSEIEEVRAGEGVLELLHELEQKPEIGLPLQGDIFNTVVRGARLGKLYLRSASSGTGKAIPNYTKIPTPDGIKRVDEIKVGDYLFDRNGMPTKVLAVYPQPEKKKVFKIYFKSGKVAECCEEHLWAYRCNSSRDKEHLNIKSLKDLIEMGNKKGFQNNNGGYRYAIPINKPLQFSEKQYSVEPYVMGLILGDGSFRYDKSQKAFMFSSEDEELPAEIYKRMGYSCYKKNSDCNYNWSFEGIYNGHKNVWVEDILKDYPELWNVKSELKHVPFDYYYGSIEQRIDLLAGLLDTDGSIDEKGRIRFTTISPFLRDDVVWLATSLGFTTSIIEDKRDKYTTGICYDVHIMASKEMKLKLFKLKRKYEIAYNYANNGKRAENREWDSIIKIEETNEYTDMTCFTVDNKEALFLMNDGIVTHNTRTMVGDCCNLAYPIRYDNVEKRWVATGHCEKVCYVSTEQDISEIQTMILSWLTGINEECFLYGTFELSDSNRIMKAVKIMQEYIDNFYLVRMPDPCASVVKNLFRRYNLQKGIQHFFYDYIFSSPAMLNEYRDLGLAEYVCLRLFTTALKNLAVELNAFIMTATQISNDDDKGGFKDHHQIQSSKMIVNLVDFACIMSRPTPDELKLVSEFGKDFGYKPNVVIDIFKNRRGRWTQVRLWGYNDLGTCRREDIFVTTPDNKPIEELRVIDFEQNKSEELLALEDFYNQQKIGEEEAEPILNAFASIVEASQESHLEHDDNFYITGAFEDQVDKAKRLSLTSIGDLL